MQIKSLNYTGNGSAGHAITGAGFDISGAAGDAGVIIFGANNVDNYLVTIATTTMPSGKAKNCNLTNALATNLVSSLDSDGFTLGTDVTTNANGKLYYAICLLDNGTGDMSIFSYTGNGADNRSLTTPGFQGDIAFVCGDVGDRACWRTSGMSGDASDFFHGAGYSTNMIQTFNATGIEIGTSSIVNTNAATYHAIVIQAVSGYISAFNYTGDGADPHAVTGVGFQPENILWAVDNNTELWHMKAMASDVVGRHENSAISGSPRLEAIGADGFTVGNSASINTNAITYHTAIINDLITTPPATYTPYRELTREIDPSDWSGTVSAILEVQGLAPDVSHPLQARLYNITTAAVVDGSDVTIDSTSTDRQRSDAFPFYYLNSVYRVEWGGIPGATYNEPVDAVLILVLH